MLRKILHILKSKNAFGTIFWFSFIGFLRPAINVFLIPLYLACISPEEYGLLSLVLVFSAIIGVFTSLKLNDAFQTFYFYYNDDEQTLWNYLSQIFTVSFILGLFWFVVLMIIGPYLFDISFASIEALFFPYGAIAIANVLILQVVFIYYTYLKNSIQVREFVVLSVLSTLVVVCFQAFFILQLDWGIKGILLGTLLSSIGQFIYITFRHPRIYTLKIQWETLKKSVLYSLPLIPFAFLFTLERHLDKLIIERYLDLEQVGLYALLMTIIGLSAILLSAMNNAFRPYLFEALKRDNHNTRAEVNRYFIIYQIIGLLVLVGILLVGSHLHLITDNVKYQSISRFIPLGLVVTAPFLMIRFIAMLFLYYQKTGMLATLTFVKLSIMFVLMLIFIPRFGINGALIAIGISNVIGLILFAYPIEKHHSKLINYIPILFRLFLFLVSVACFFLLKSFLSAALLSWLILVLLAFVFYFLDKKKPFRFSKRAIEIVFLNLKFKFKN